jgi:hypothetical protein
VLARAADRIATVLAAYGVPAGVVAEEIRRMGTHRVGTTANRSVVGIMTDFGRLADVRRHDEPDPDLNDLEAWLATVPCSPLYATYGSPDRAFTAFVHAGPP